MGKEHKDVTMALVQKPTPFSLRRRLQLCLAMLALESFISFEEIFMLPVLQRVQVPVMFVSLPGTISSAIGVFVIPLLGWASDRSTRCSKQCGKKRPFALWTLAVCMAGICLLLFVTSTSLYSHHPLPLSPLLNTTTTTASSGMGSVFSEAPSDVVASGGDTRRRREMLENTSSGSRPQLLSNINVTSSEVESQLLSSGINISEIDDRLSSNTTEPLSLQPATLSLLPLYHPSTPTIVHGSENVSYITSGYMTTLGVLGIVSFVLCDHGYDSSMSTFKAYMIAVTPATQHDNIFIMTTLTGAIGGCITSLLGFVDLASLFPDTGGVLDEGVAQCLAQASILLLKLLLLGSVSLMTGSEKMRYIYEDNDSDSETIFDELGNGSKEPGMKSPSADESHLDDNVNDNEEIPLIAEPPSGSGNPCLAPLASFWKRWKARVILCAMTFLGLSANYSYFVYVSNFVAEVIYSGDPNAVSGSAAYENYVEGVHIASLGMLTFYVLFVVYNIFHQKIIGKIGMRGEYLGASVVCAVLMVTLAVTNDIIVYFLIAVGMAMFRAAVYTVPFILSNNLAKQEAIAGSEDSSHSSGVAMASISVMIPGSYFLVSLIMGPLMEVTGYPGMPIFIAACSCALGIVAAVFVRFE